MVRFSVCIEMILKELPFLDRIDAVAQNGFPAFEFWHWRSKDIEGIRSRKREYGLTISAFCVEPFNIPLVDSKTRNEFIKGLKETIEVAHKLECSKLIVLSGNETEGVPRTVQNNNIVEILRESARLVEKAGITLLLEPLNTLVDHKGYYLGSADEGFSIIKDVNSPNLKLLFDIYHQQIARGNIMNTITLLRNYIGHFHVADVPGRHEPGTGEINYPRIFKEIDLLGYDGFVGLEFRPVASSREALEKVLRLKDAQ